MLSEQQPITPKVRCSRHPTSHVNRFCISVQCPYTRVFCENCPQIQHQNHKTVPLNELVNSINRQAVHEERQHHFKSLLGSLQKNHKNWLQWIESTRKSIDMIFKTLETKISGWFANMNIIMQRFLSETISPKEFKNTTKHFSIAVLSSVDNFRTENKYDEVVNSYRKCLSEQEKKQSAKLEAANDKLQNLLFQYLQDSRVLTKQIESVLTKHRFGQTVDQFHLCLNFGTSGSLAWNPALRHKDISIMKGIAYRQVETIEQVSVAALLDIALYTNSTQTYRWGCRIVEKSLYIGIGICLESEARSGFFEEGSWEYLGHGHYINDSAGGTYSHSDPDLNHKVTSFGYEVGDVIHVQFNPIKQLLTFIKNWKEEFNMTIAPAGTGEFYRPCVYFSKPGDCVEIVESK